LRIEKYGNDENYGNYGNYLGGLSGLSGLSGQGVKFEGVSTASNVCVVVMPML